MFTLRVTIVVDSFAGHETNFPRTHQQRARQVVWNEMIMLYCDCTTISDCPATATGRSVHSHKTVVAALDGTSVNPVG
jgi:hypothetical protein